MSFGWDRWVGPHGAMIAVESFGISAPGPQAMEAFGITADHLVQVAEGVLEGRTRGVVASRPAGLASHGSAR